MQSKLCQNGSFGEYPPKLRDKIKSFNQRKQLGENPIHAFSLKVKVA